VRPAGLRPSIVLVALVLVAACRSQTYRGQGDLVSVDSDGATIAHEAIPGLMDAMTMRFPARPPTVLEDAQPGTRVEFDLVREGDALILVRMAPIGFAKGSTPGTHDHRPRFGGVVSMLGLVHVEVTATPNGRVRAYLSDLWRRPMPVRGVTGTVRLNLPAGAETATFADAGEALEARMRPFTVESALANIALVRKEQPLEMNVLLDLTGNRAGVPIVPQTGCVPPAHGPQAGRGPRCTVSFSQTFSAVGVLFGGSRIAVATGHGATTIWRLPEATLLMGLEPPPAIPVEPGKHEPDPRVLVVGPDDADLLMAIGTKLVFFDAATGRLRRALEGPGGTVGTAVWLPDGRQLLVVAGADRKPHLLSAADGRVVRTLEVADRVVVAAIDRTGRWAAAGTEVGTIALVDLRSEAAPRVLTPSLQPVAALGFAGGRLVSAGTDGTLRTFDPESGRETSRVDLGATIIALALSSDGRLAATASGDHVITLYRLPGGGVVERLQWHRATIGALAFGAGPTLVSCDNDGELAVWDVAAP
jgi:Cu/Ag efflux protein CusF